MNLLNLQTNKLFYNKWPYKISCKIEGIHLLRFYKYDVARLHCDSVNIKFYRGQSKFDLDSLNTFCLLGKEFIDDKDVKKRIEFNKIDFYVLTESKFNDLINSLKNYVYSTTSPTNYQELTTLKSNNNFVLCKKLPHNKYKFKVTFKDMPLSIRQHLINWAERYNNEDIYINNSTRTHFKGLKFKYGAHYFYIKDKKMLSFIFLAAAGYIRKTDEFVVREIMATV